MSDLKSEFEYYLANKQEFLSKYKGKFVAIKNHEVLGVFEDRLLAIKETQKSHPVGTFLVQLVSEKEDTVRFHSRYAG